MVIKNLNLLFALVLCTTSVLAAPIDITAATGGFVISDPVFVSFGSAINEVTLKEDQLSGVTYSSNDPFLGDTGIFVPTNAITISFDYLFETTGSDNFSLALLDSSGGAPLYFYQHDGSILAPGIYVGDDILIDLVTLGIQGSTIGIEFMLTSNLNDLTYDAEIRFSDVRFNNQTIPSASSPGTLMLIVPGILILFSRNVLARRRELTKLNIVVLRLNSV